MAKKKLRRLALRTPSEMTSNGETDDLEYDKLEQEHDSTMSVQRHYHDSTMSIQRHYHDHDDQDQEEDNDHHDQNPEDLDQEPEEKEVSDFSALLRIQMKHSEHILDVINRLHTHGLGQHILPPRLVICGGRSVGKSSVLEALTGIPFPRGDGGCTQFATEITYRHSPEPVRVMATIRPHELRSETKRERLLSYQKVLQNGFVDLPGVIQEVISLNHSLGTAGEGFSITKDTLCIHVTGKTGLYLTIVDIPGLIDLSGKEKADDDVLLAPKLIETYLTNRQSLILAVMEASKTSENLEVLKMCEQVDPEGKRTVGIITKPDLLDESEKLSIAHANNRHMLKFHHGFFLIKNTSLLLGEDMIHDGDRDREEVDFFNKAPWNTIHMSAGRTGISSLRDHVQEWLEFFLEKQIPEARREISLILLETGKELGGLGTERPGPADQRAYLVELSMRFCGLVQTALTGSYPLIYDDLSDDCGHLVQPNRLRAEIHCLNLRFSSCMQNRGRKREVNIKLADNTPDQPLETGQLIVCSTSHDQWIKEAYMRAKSRRLLPDGKLNLVWELFREQSGLWEGIARKHISDTTGLIENFVGQALGHIVRDETVRERVRKYVSEKVEASYKAAVAELELLLMDEKGPPITYNKRYAKIVQTGEDVKKRRKEKDALVAASSPADRPPPLPDLDAQACAEIAFVLGGYYKISQETFVDNVCRQVIERHLVADLPEAFTPMAVVHFSDEQLNRLGWESQAQRERRCELGKMERNLTICLESLHN